MSEALHFLSQYFAAEYDMTIAAYTDRERSQYRSLKLSVRAHVTKPFRPYLIKDIYIFDEDFDSESVAQQLSQVARRTLYLTACWQHPELGRVLTAFVDRPTKQALGVPPSICLHVLLDLEAPQIVAKDVRCAPCLGTGHNRFDASVVCDHCFGQAWRPSTGSLDIGSIDNIEQAQLHVPRSSLEASHLSSLLTHLGLAAAELIDAPSRLENDAEAAATDNEADVSEVAAADEARDEGCTTRSRSIEGNASWETRIGTRLAYVDVRKDGVCIGTQSGNPHSDNGSICSLSEFLNGRFHQHIRDLHGESVLREIIVEVSKIHPT